MSQCCGSFSSGMESDANNSLQTKLSATTARLDQNIPNPSNNSSSISYNIPLRFHNAQLMITDALGHILKTYSITQSGPGKQIINQCLASRL
ncbi:MAG TPA: hypothetical protein VFW07_09055 [Parafilimonas sp.]|nr:hypothetical protein [Parafilimonas sp.]